MKITAKLNHLRMSPQKIRLVADIVRGMDVTAAENQLKFLTQKAADIILKLLNSAIANAHHNFGIEKDNLFISEIQINQGPPLKRWRARAMGRSASILKRTSHINLVLETKKEVKIKKTKKTKPEIIKADEKMIKTEITQPVAEQPETETKKPKPTPPPRPYPTTSQAKKRFFSRQTFGNFKKDIKRVFRRKSF